MATVDWVEVNGERAAREIREKRAAREEAEREAAIEAALEVERRAQRQAQEQWDARLHDVLEEQKNHILDVVGMFFGEERDGSIRDLIEKMIDTALREPMWMPRVAGVWREDGEYGRLNVVSRNGSTWLAKRDHPKGEPGASDDWSLLANRGSRGPIGPSGPRGETGPPGPSGPRGSEITGWSVDAKRFQVRPILDHGKSGYGPSLDLRELFLEYERQKEDAPIPAKSTFPSCRPSHETAPMVRMIEAPPPEGPAE